MGYFVKGWNTFKFLVSPIELENVLNGFHFLINNQRVPENYVETDPKEYFEKYKMFYEKLVSNYKFTWKTDHNITDLMMGFSSDLSKCGYGKIFMDKNNKKYYKSPDFKEPSVGINPFILFLDKNRKLFSNYSYTQFPENLIGLQIEYPKQMHYYDKESKEITETINLNETDTYNNVYKIIVERVKQISRNLCFTIDGKEYKTVIKISKNIFEDVKKIYFIKNNNCVIK
jgi:hypothetical protein